METNITYNLDALAGGKQLPDQSVDCIVTSPPYYGLRDYGVAGQIGLEETAEAYIERLVTLFRELRRPLKDGGTLWVNIADSYARSKKGDCKKKDLIGIPWMLGFALRADGWYLRQDIIWSKPNPMPESVADRCTKSHEYIFLLSKSNRYYFDAEAIKEPAKESTLARIAKDVDSQKGSNRVPGKTNGRMKAVIGGRKREKHQASLNPSDPMYRHNTYREYEYTDKANKRSVWTVSTKPSKEVHFATYSEDLIAPCILAGCPEGGVVLDPFHGSGTTGITANKLGRKYIGFELNPDYMKIEARRRHNELGMFK